MVEASPRFEVVRRGQVTDGGSSFKKLLSSFAQIWESVFTRNFCLLKFSGLFKFSDRCHKEIFADRC